MKRYISRGYFNMDSTETIPSWRDGVEVFAIDLDDQERVSPPRSLDEQHQHAERLATHWLAEYQRLCAEVKKPAGTCEKPDDREQMRAVIAAMRPIVEAAMPVVDRWARLDKPWSTDVGRLIGAVAANRERLELALAAWKGGETSGNSERDHDRARPKGIACSGCGGADSVCNCDCGYHPCGCSCHRLEPAP